MKRIKFTELGFKKNLDSLIVIIGFILFIIGFTALFGIFNEKLSSLAGLAALLILYPQTKNFFFKNYIFWNKKGGSMKLNYKSFSFQFEDIKNIAIENEKLLIDLKNGSSKEFSIIDINQEDLNNLLMILKK